MTLTGSVLARDVCDALLRQAQVVQQLAEKLPSPCVSICRMDEESGLCLGCLRNIDEICRWSAMNDRDKQAVWRLIEQRCSDLSGAVRP